MHRSYLHTTRWIALELCKRQYAKQTTPHQEALMARGLPRRAPLPGVENIIVVASGKGGVGKSTVAVNLAVTLSDMGQRVGLLDADIFGPSVPLMMNIHETPLIDKQNLMLPPLNFGVKCLSMGLLTQTGDAIIWRGPLVMSALQRLLKGAVWGPLDVLIVDTPPGTGDVHLSLSQQVPISGVLLISTPQSAALEVTLRGAQMYRKLQVPLIGLVQNMAHIICHKCQTQQQIFPQKEKELNLIKELKVPLITSLPLDGSIAACGDEGIPLVAKHRNSEYAQCYKTLAQHLLTYIKNNKQETNKVT